MKNKKKSNVYSFQSKETKIERQIEAILFAASEPLDIETIEKRLQTSINLKTILENLQEISFISKDSKIIVADTMEPVIFSTDKDIEVSLCGCKESNNVPYCSGAHVNI